MDYIFGGLNATEEMQLPELHLACMERNVDYVKYLLKFGAPVNEPISDNSFLWSGCTALHLAVDPAIEVNMELVELLLKHNADVTVKNARGLTPVTLANKNENASDLVPLLLRAQKSFCDNPQTEDDEMTNFNLACVYDVPDVLEAYLREGVDVNTPTKGGSSNGYTPLHLAAVNSRIGNVKVLCSPRYKADITRRNRFGETPLHVAVEYSCSSEIVDAMLALHEQYCENPINDLTGVSHFHIACMRHSMSIVAIFLERGVDINEPTLWDSHCWPSYTPLHFAAKYANAGVVQLLVKHGASVDAQDRHGRTPLHMSVLNDNCEEVAEVLLEAGANVNAYMTYKGYESYTPLHWAAEKGHHGLVELLLAYGADMLCRESTRSLTPLHLACMNFHVKTLQVLLDHGANPNELDGLGRTPIFVCVEHHNFDRLVARPYFKVISTLMESGGDTEHHDTSGNTALHQACGDCNEDAVRALLLCGANIDAYNSLRNLTPVHSWTINVHFESPTFILEQIEILRLQGLRRFSAKDDPIYKPMLVDSIVKLDEIVKIQQKCQEEYNSMADTYLDHYTSVKDLLHKSAVDFLRLIKNDAVKKLISSGDLEERFPIFAHVIKHRFVCIKKQLPLLECALSTAICEWNLPIPCTETIFLFLDDSELRAICDAYKYP